MYKVSAPGATPEAVALKALSKSAAENTASEAKLKTKAAGILFSANGVAPKRLAQGDDWKIEPWEGLGNAVLDSVEKFEMYGRLFAQVSSGPPIAY